MSLLTTEPVLDPIYGYWSLYTVPNDKITPSQTLSDQFKNYSAYMSGISYNPTSTSKFDARKLGIILAAAGGAAGLAVGGVFLAKKKLVASTAKTQGGMI